MKGESAAADLVAALAHQSDGTADAADLAASAELIGQMAATARGAYLLAAAGAIEQLAESWAAADADPGAAEATQAVARAVLAVATHSAGGAAVRRLLALVARLESPAAQTRVLQVLRQAHEKGASSGWVGTAPSACLDLRGSDAAPGPGQARAMAAGWCEAGAVGQASLALPAPKEWPAAGYTFFSWIRLEQRPAAGPSAAAALLPVVTFASRDTGWQLALAAGEPRKLVLRLTANAAAPAVVEHVLPYTFGDETWYHIALVHTHPGAVAMYVNGKAVDLLPSEVPYPKMAPGPLQKSYAGHDCSDGAWGAKAAAPDMQLGNMHLLDTAVTAELVEQAFSAGEDETWLAGLHSQCSLAASSAAQAWLARTPTGASLRGKGNACMLTGSSLRTTLDRGAGAIVLQLVALVGVMRGAAPLGMLFTLLAAVVPAPVARFACIQGNAITKIACFLHNWSPMVVSGPTAEEDTSALISGLEVLLSSFEGSPLWAQAQKTLAWNMQLWVYAPAQVQFKLFEMLASAVAAKPQQYREQVGVSLVLDIFRLCYWRLQPGEPGLPVEVVRGGVLCERPRKDLRRLRIQLLTIVSSMIHDQPTEGEVEAIILVAVHCKDDGLVQDALRLLVQLSGGSRGTATVQHLNSIGGLYLFLRCVVQSSSEQTDVLTLRLMGCCLSGDGCVVTGLDGLVSALTAAFASRPFTEDRLRAVMEFVAPSQAFRVPSGLRSVLVLATEAPDSIRQASLAQLEQVGGKQLLCEMLAEIPGFDRLLVEFACTPCRPEEGLIAPSALLRPDAEVTPTVIEVAALLSGALLCSFGTESGRLTWQSALFSFDEACREPGQCANLGCLLREKTYHGILTSLKLQVPTAAIDAGADEPGHIWASLCYFLAKAQWKKIIDTFPSQNPDVRGEFACLISSLLADIVSKFQDAGSMQAMNKQIQSVEGKTLFDVVLMNIIQALLLKRDDALVEIVNTLCQLELDDGDEDVLLVDGRLAFCVANMLKCLSTDARSGRTSADAAIAACDDQLVETLSDVLMLRWDSLAKIMRDANGVGLMDSMEDEPPHAPVAEFVPIMFGATWKPILTQMQKLSLDSAKHFMLQKDEYDNKQTEIALNAERETQCVLSTAAMGTSAALPLVPNKTTDDERLSWALPRVNAEMAACTAALAELTDASALPIWEVDGTELKDRSRVRMQQLWGGTNHMDAARVPEDQGSADGGGTAASGSYNELLDSLRGFRSTPVDAGNREHAALLDQLWTLLMPGVPAKDWTKLGFQNADPSTDFRAMGLLALKNLVSFAATHQAEAALIASAAQSNPGAHYPLAITAINVTGWIFSMMENHTLSGDHFEGAESLGMMFTGFTIERVNELYSQTLLRFDRHWSMTAPESVMQFTQVANEFLQEQLWDLAASGRLRESLDAEDQASLAAAEEPADDADDEYYEEIRKMAEATDTALKAAEEAKNADIMSIFDMSMDAFGPTGGGGAENMPTATAAAAGAGGTDDSFSAAVDVTKDEVKAQVEVAKAQAKQKFSSFGRKAAEKKEEARKAAAIARAQAQVKAQEAQKRARVVSESASVLGDRISATASLVAGEALERADSIAKRNVVDLSRFHQARCEVECIWESQRRIMGSWRSSYLLTGTDFHAWTNRIGRMRIRLSGKPFVSKDDLQIDKSWCWLSDWCADVVDDHTDSDGFTYAATFTMPLNTWQAQPNACHFVRRRCWFRLRHPAVSDTLSPPKLPASRAADIARVLLDANDSQLKRLRGWFDELDENSVGSLDINQIESLLIKLGKTLGGQDLDTAVSEMDQSGSGRVDYVDFCDWWQSTASKRKGIAEESPRDEPDPEPEEEQAPGGQSAPALPASGPVLVEEVCELITVDSVVLGKLAVLRKGEAVFTSKEEGKADRVWSVDSIVEVHRRRYMMQWHGLELMLADCTTVLLNFPAAKTANKHAFDAIVALRKSPLRRALFGAAVEAAELESLRAAWSAGALSNFEYLMHLNTLASRTYCDLSQYPVFPWVLSDYNSATLDLTNPAVYRDLSKPVGALNPSRLQKFLNRAEAIRDMPDMPFFLYGTHYSNLGAVSSFLLRMEPFTSIHVDLQSGTFDSPDRLFHSIPLAWKGVNSNMADLKELPPEFYSCPDFLTNGNKLPLGQMQSGAKVDNVVLPAWATSADDFIQTHRAALESDHVSAHLHEWIDLVFGHKQRGEAAEAAHNVFYHLTYEGAVDMDGLSSDLIAAESIKAQIANFGQTPAQILTTPHTARGCNSIDRPLSTPHSLQLDTSGAIATLEASGQAAFAVETAGQIFLQAAARGAFVAGALTCFAVEPACGLLAAGSADGRVSLWRLPAAGGGTLKAWGGLVQSPLFVAEPVTAIAVSSSFDMIVAGCSDGSVHTARLSSPGSVVRRWCVADGQPVSTRLAPRLILFYVRCCADFFARAGAGLAGQRRAWPHRLRDEVRIVRAHPQRREPRAVAVCG